MAENAVKLSIDGMHCGSCVRRVTNALGALKGVIVDRVEVGRAEVHGDGQAVDREALVKAVNDLGFKVRSAEG